jgi:hypothetical protein
MSDLPATAALRQFSNKQDSTPEPPRSMPEKEGAKHIQYASRHSFWSVTNLDFYYI